MQQTKERVSEKEVPEREGTSGRESPERESPERVKVTKEFRAEVKIVSGMIEDVNEDKVKQFLEDRLGDPDIGVVTVGSVKEVK